MLAQLISVLGFTKPKSRYQPSGLFLGGFGKNLLPNLLNWALCSYRTEVLLPCWSQLGDCLSSLRLSALLVTLYFPSSNLSWHVKSFLFSKFSDFPFVTSSSLARKVLFLRGSVVRLAHLDNQRYSSYFKVHNCNHIVISLLSIIFTDSRIRV